MGELGLAVRGREDIEPLTVLVRLDALAAAFARLLGQLVFIVSSVVIDASTAGVAVVGQGWRRG